MRCFVSLWQAADKTKEQTVALMRLTWWRDRLDALNQVTMKPLLTCQRLPLWPTSLYS